jgi:hypothetical protein
MAEWSRRGKTGPNFFWEGEGKGVFDRINKINGIEGRKKI